MSGTGGNYPIGKDVGLRNSLETRINPATSEKQDDIITAIKAAAGLVILPYDYISCSYTGSNLTGVIFKTGGSGGTTVATLVLTYDGSDNLLTVTKT